MALVAGLASAWGQASRAESLVDIYQLAETRDPVLAQVQSRRLATREAKPQARADLLPNVALSADTTDNNQDIQSSGTAFGASGSVDFNSNAYTLTVTQPLFRYDRWVALKQADRLIERAELEVRAAEQALVVRVAERYFDALAAQDSLQFAKAERDALERQLTQVQQRFEVGVVAITDVQEAQAAYDLAVADVILAENAVDNAFEAVRELTGEYPGRLNGLQETIPLVPPAPADIEAWTDSALEGNLTLAINQADASVAEKEIDRQRAAHYPTVDMVGTLGEQATGGRFGGTDTEFNSLGLQVNVPIFAGLGTRSRVREATFQHQAALDGVEAARREAHRQTREAYLGVTSGLSRIQALRQAVVSSQTAVDATVAGFEVGTRTTVDVVGAERDLFRARRDYARARYDYIVDSLRLKQAAGSLGAGDLNQVDAWLEGSEPESS